MGATFTARIDGKDTPVQDRLALAAMMRAGILAPGTAVYDHAKGEWTTAAEAAAEPPTAAPIAPAPAAPAVEPSGPAPSASPPPATPTPTSTAKAKTGSGLGVLMTIIAWIACAGFALMLLLGASDGLVLGSLLMLACILLFLPPLTKRVKPRLRAPFYSWWIRAVLVFFMFIGFATMLPKAAPREKPADAKPAAEAKSPAPAPTPPVLSEADRKAAEEAEQRRKAEEAANAAQSTVVAALRCQQEPTWNAAYRIKKVDQGTLAVDCFFGTIWSTDAQSGGEQSAAEARDLGARFAAALTSFRGSPEPPKRLRVTFYTAAKSDKYGNARPPIALVTFTAPVQKALSEATKYRTPEALAKRALTFIYDVGGEYHADNMNYQIILDATRATDEINNP